MQLSETSEEAGAAIVTSSGIRSPCPTLCNGLKYAVSCRAGPRPSAKPSLVPFSFPLGSFIEDTSCWAPPTVSMHKARLAQLLFRTKAWANGISCDSFVAIFWIRRVQALEGKRLGTNMVVIKPDMLGCFLCNPSYASGMESSRAAQSRCIPLISCATERQIVYGPMCNFKRFEMCRRSDRGEGKNRRRRYAFALRIDCQDSVPWNWQRRVWGAPP